MRDDNNVAMLGITEDDYEALLGQLTEELTAAMRLDGWKDCEPTEMAQWACDALTNTWQDYQTANQWLYAAGRCLNVNTTSCVGA